MQTTVSGAGEPYDPSLDFVAEERTGARIVHHFVCELCLELVEVVAGTEGPAHSCASGGRTLPSSSQDAEQSLSSQQGISNKGRTRQPL